MQRMNSNSPEVRALVQAMADKLMQVRTVRDDFPLVFFLIHVMSFFFLSHFHQSFQSSYYTWDTILEIFSLSVI